MASNGFTLSEDFFIASFSDSQEGYYAYVGEMKTDPTLNIKYAVIEDTLQ